MTKMQRTQHHKTAGKKRWRQKKLKKHQLRRRRCITACIIFAVCMHRLKELYFIGAKTKWNILQKNDTAKQRIERFCCCVLCARSRLLVYSFTRLLFHSVLLFFCVIFVSFLQPKFKNLSIYITIFIYRFSLYFFIIFCCSPKCKCASEREIQFFVVVVGFACVWRVYSKRVWLCFDLFCLFFRFEWYTPSK